MLKYIFIILFFTVSVSTNAFDEENLKHDAITLLETVAGEHNFVGWYVKISQVFLKTNCKMIKFKRCFAKMSYLQSLKNVIFPIKLSLGSSCKFVCVFLHFFSVLQCQPKIQITMLLQRYSRWFAICLRSATFLANGKLFLRNLNHQRKTDHLYMTSWRKLTWKR